MTAGPDEASVRPLCSGEIVISGSVGVVLHRFWANAGGATIEVPFSATDRRRISCGASELPSSLARLIRLGPRPRLAATTCRIGGDSIAGLFADAAGPRQAAAQVIGDTSGRIWGRALAHSWGPDGTWRASRLVVRWTHPPREPASGVDDEPWPVAERCMLLFDTPAGLTTSIVGAGQPELVPTDPTEVWVGIIGLFPTDDELGLGDEPGEGPTEGERGGSSHAR